MHMVKCQNKYTYFGTIQSELYVESKNGALISAEIPPTFQNCSRDGIRPGCLVKYDFPSEQCADRRKGGLASILYII